MPRFLAVHPTAFKEDDLRALALRRAELPEGLIWHSSYCSPSDDVTFCHWEAPDKQTLLGAFETFKVPVGAVHEVERFDPAVAVRDAA